MPKDSEVAGKVVYDLIVQDLMDKRKAKGKERIFPFHISWQYYFIFG